MKTWTIEDTRKLTKGYQHVSGLPTQEDIKSLSPGDFVRLSLKSTDPENTCNEPLWVGIESSSEGKFRGSLYDNPLHFKEIKHDDVIEFEETNIIDFNTYRPGMGIPWAYSQECLVPLSVLRDGEKPRYICWSPPEDASESGWVIYTGDLFDDATNGTENMVCAPLREVVYRDNSFKHLLFLNKFASYYWDEEEKLWIEDVDD